MELLLLHGHPQQFAFMRLDRWSCRRWHRLFNRVAVTVLALTETIPLLFESHPMVGQVRLSSATPPSSPRSSLQRSPVSDLWERLRTCITGISNYVNARLISNESELTVPCPAATVVRVKIGSASVPMHTNTITFDSVRAGSAAPANAPANVRQAIAGRSPRMPEECEKFLVQGLESGRGLFQFISPRALRVSNGSGEKPSKVTPIIEQLNKAMKDKKPANVMLAGRYEVLELKKITDGVQDHCCYELKVRDQDNGGVEISVPLTQAGLRFDQRVLEPDDIERANVLLDQHRNRLGQCDTAAPDPMIVSTGGIGRNATLITYRQVLARMGTGLNAADLLKEIEVAVKDGRRDRGPGFIHSEQQLKALHDALALKLAQPARPASTGGSAMKTRLSTIASPSQVPPIKPAARTDQERCDAEDVTDTAHLKFCGHYKRELKDIRGDSIVPMGIGTEADSLRGVLKSLNSTHKIQSISPVNNLCWLRSSWLPLFYALEPDEMVKRLVAITPDEKKADAMKEIVPLLHAIATLFRKNPDSFMQRGFLRQNEALLGPDTILAEVFKGKSLPGVPTANLDQTIESFLKTIQLNIAAAFRERGSQLMGEIHTLSNENAQAPSELPVTLHRAFDVPVLVVESHPPTGTGQDVNLKAQLRIATNDQELMDMATALAVRDGPEPEGIQTLMNVFRNRIVIKLTGGARSGHYELYIPKN
ncbi:MAG: hypothetical protein GZ090_11580 [Oxalobacteraceae bacterium]|nr:hypothetical protein [Oxalobacteraceae bacterium]